MFLSVIKLGRNMSPRDVFALTKGDGYQLHRLIWNLFADNPDRRRDFLYRHETVDNWPTFYTVSERKPSVITGDWEVKSKEYSPKLSAGQRLSFMLRANPICSKRDEENKQHRHDVVMEAKSRLREQGESRLLSLLTQEEGSNWLSARAARCGFAFMPEHIRVDGYQQHRFFKGKGNKQVSLSTLDFNGVLTVTEPELFLETLYRGIGPAKGFGCGLMLVRRV
ncbi:MAG: type I-E CRISPR-associated protein Cas6/Cse3/CasE [Candidatus Aquicultor sp.]|nr:type I-E CRISPR-associated protein Cas6/Cse3/CasE [Candidatus Aquicultor sp.]